MGVSNQRGPDAALIGSAQEDEEPECRHHEAEDGHEHHPAQRVVWKDVSWRHQDPNQTSKHLQGHTQEELRVRSFEVVWKYNNFLYFTCTVCNMHFRVVFLLCSDRIRFLTMIYRDAPLNLQ